MKLVCKPTAIRKVSARPVVRSIVFTRLVGRDQLLRLEDRAAAAGARVLAGQGAGGLVVRHKLDPGMCA